uniref:Uncharacterized protein n=1 Tax=Aegilops tauschii TaxID=37682 RepID=M8BA62_AEGTA
MSFAKKLKTHHTQSWSALPSELAGLVLRRLPSHADRVRFAAVCHHWRFSTQEHCLTQPLPWLAFPDGTFFVFPHGEAAKESFKLHSSANYCISCSDWLAFAQNGTCFLMDPFSEITLTLPNLSSFCLVDEPVAIINGRDVLDEDMSCPLLQMDTAIFLRKRGQYNGKLRVSRIERLLDGAPCVLKLIQGGISYFESYLVESHGALLLVQRTIFGECDNDTIGGIKPVGIEFEVCQSDFQSRSWEKVSSVGGDQTLFVSQSSSQSVDVSQYKLKGDCIYFLDDGSCDWFWKDAPSSCAVYDMRDGNCFFIPLPTVACKDVKMLAAWLFPQN